MHRFIAIVLLCTLTGCANLGVLKPLEQGRAAQLAGDAQASQKAFAEALQDIRTEDDRALISASGTAQTGLSLVSNDVVRRYRVSPFERLFLYPYQAFNYLALNQPEAALVEMRRANEWQRTQALVYADSVRKAEESSQQQGIQVQNGDQVLGPLNAAAARVKSSVQHAGALYIAGLLFESSGQINDAYIDYSEALSLVPDNSAVRNDVLRTGRQMGFVPGQANINPGNGDLIVYWEDGLAPRKSAIPLPVITSRALTLVSVPFYANVGRGPYSLPFQVNGRNYYAEPLVDTDALAARALREQMPGILVRTTLRAIAKQTLQRELNERSPGLGAISTVYSLLSEQPDLRAWTNLPAQVLLQRLSLPAGAQRVDIPGMPSLLVDVPAGRRVLLHVVTAPGVRYSRLYTL